MADLNVALVLRLIDQMSAPLRKVKEALGGVKGETGQASDGLGKVTDGAKGAGTALKEAFGPHLPSQIDAMNRSAERSAGVFTRLGRNVREFGAGVHQGLRETLTVENYRAALEKNERDIAAARGRLMGAAGMAMSLAGPVWVAGNFQRDLIAYGNLADMSRAQLAALGAELDKLSRHDRTGMGKSDLLAGLSTYVGKGLKHEDGVIALEATGRAAKATGASFDEMAAAGFAAMDNLKVAPEQLGKAFDIMAASGKEGSFELQDMARKFPELTASAQALGMKGEEGVASLAAALQIAMKAAGSADQAANNASNFLGKLTSQDAVKKFSEAGISIEKELQKALKNGTDPLEHMLNVIAKYTDGDQFKMGELFADKQVLDFLRAAIPNLEEYRRIKQAAASAEGVVDRDYENVMTGFNESVTQLKSSFVGLFSASGALLPALTDLVQTATGMVDALRDWTAANPELTAWLVKGAALMLTMGIAGRVLGFAFAVARGNLIRFMSIFLKFNEAGRNISVVARLLRGLGRGFSWAKVIPRLAWRGIITPLRWASFIPKAAWSALGGVLRWGKLIPFALKWTSRLIPVIGWAVLAGELLWSFLIKPLGWDKWIKDIDWKALLAAFSWDNIITKALSISDYILSFSWADLLPDWDWGAIIPDLGAFLRGLGRGFRWAKVIQRFAWRGIITPLRWASFIPKAAWSALGGVLRWGKLIPFALKWTSHHIPGIEWAFFAGKLLWEDLLDTLAWADWIFEIDWKGILGIFSWDDIITTALNVGDYIASFKWTDFLPDWDWGLIIPDLGEFLRGSTVVQGGSMSEGDVAAWAMTPAALPAFGPALPSDTAAIEAYLKTTRIQAPAAAGGLGAARPVPKPDPVKIEETINHDYTANHTVDVSVRNHITKQYMADVDALAREVGLKTERATRKALSDAALPQ